MQAEKWQKRETAEQHAFVSLAACWFSQFLSFLDSGFPFRTHSSTCQLSARLPPRLSPGCCWEFCSRWWLYPGSDWQKGEWFI